eukprot:5308234-Amphidinium_carterae.1
MPPSHSRVGGKGEMAGRTCPVPSPKEQATQDTNILRMQRLLWCMLTKTRVVSWLRCGRRA